MFHIENILAHAQYIIVTDAIMYIMQSQVTSLLMSKIWQKIHQETICQLIWTMSKHCPVSYRDCLCILFLCIFPCVNMCAV